MFELRTWLWIAFGLHGLFTILEMWPFGTPILLRVVMRKKNVEIADPNARNLVSMIVRNAGAYNVIIAAGFLCCLFPESSRFPTDPQSAKGIQSLFFGGAIFAGLFGGATLSPVTCFQALVGVIGMYFVWSK